MTHLEAKHINQQSHSEEAKSHKGLKVKTNIKAGPRFLSVSKPNLTNLTGSSRRGYVATNRWW